MGNPPVGGINTGPPAPLPLERSRYNCFVDRPDGVMGYNARTGTFALLSPDIAHMLRSDRPVAETADTPSLLEMGFLHRGDEYEQIVATYQNGKSTGQALGLTIAPTLACNRSC